MSVEHSQVNAKPYNKHLAPVKVLYIAGFERSGSTIFTKVVGEMDGVFAAGELQNIWKRSYIDNIPCGCGRLFQECPVWNDVTVATFGSWAEVHPQWILSHRGGRRMLPLMLLPCGRRFAASRYAEYLAILERLYQSIQETTGARVIVDSSKGPVYEYMLGLIPGIELYVLNLVRDPRGVQYSLIRRQQEGDPWYVNHSVKRSSLAWVGKNLLHEVQTIPRRRRSLRMRYESFIDDPPVALERVLRLIDEPRLAIPDISQGTVELQQNHIMGGSPHRREFGKTQLRHDDAWLTRMIDKQRALVTRLTYPMLRWYGYAANPPPTIHHGDVPSENSVDER